MEQIYNPYLPLWEHIPDGEPHVFGDRVYIYGSHDKVAGEDFCLDHYTVWSAPLTNLRDWRCEGTSYMRDQDPSNADGKLAMWAPDVTQGPDGRYYLYYCLSGGYPEIGVAVSDSPAGPFEFYGHVHYPENILGGKNVTEKNVFDPAVLVDDDGRVYLYYGSSNSLDNEKQIPVPEGVEGLTSSVMELEPDMLTAKEEPRPLIPAEYTGGTGFEGHVFFEASSIRKIRGRYYFIYSSQLSHELCYAVSDKPDRDFVYGGILVSNGDIGLGGRRTPCFPLGNNHGSLVEIGDALYVFYHRHCNGTEFSRQGCAERVTMDAEGRIPQVPITSCGLNGDALHASGVYPAAICCHLMDPVLETLVNYRDPIRQGRVMIKDSQNQCFVANITNKTTVGYKYFQFVDADLLLLEIRGKFFGEIHVSTDEDGEDVIGEFELQENNSEWENILIPISVTPGRHALYIHFEGKGKLDLKTIGFLSM